MPQPLMRHKKTRKHRPSRFMRHQSDQFLRIRGTGWRKPKGIDSAVRRRFRGRIKMPRIGYGSDRKSRHVLPSGFLKFRVNNVAELEMLLMHNRTYAAELPSNLSAMKRQAIVKRAKQLDIKVLNPGKLVTSA